MLYQSAVLDRIVTLPAKHASNKQREGAREWQSAISGVQNFDILTSGYVSREVGAWSITDLGRAFLASIEQPESEPVVVAPEVPFTSPPRGGLTAREQSRQAGRPTASLVWAGPWGVR